MDVTVSRLLVESPQPHITGHNIFMYSFGYALAIAFFAAITYVIAGSTAQ